MEIKKEKALCFTGHRVIAADKSDRLSELVHHAVLIYIRRGYEYFLTGGAFGFDTLAAECIARLKSEGHNIKLILVLPCRDHTSKWKNATNIRAFERTLKAADDVIYTSEEYTEGCMQIRNRFLVDNSNACVAYKVTDRGGTGYTCRYAKKQGIELVNLGELCTQLTFS